MHNLTPCEGPVETFFYFNLNPIQRVVSCKCLLNFTCFTIKFYRYHNASEDSTNAAILSDLQPNSCCLLLRIGGTADFNS